MNIGILGSGRIGATTARLFARAGHFVAIAHARGPESLAPLVSDIGSNARATTTEDAARFGEVVLLAIPWRDRTGLPPSELLAGKIVIDAMNPYGASGVEDFGDSTSSEEIAKQLPGARLVRAFNTMYFETLATEGKPNAPLDGRLVLFVAGDDAEAKTVISKLIEEIGFAPYDTGSLHEGGMRQEPGSPIYNKPMTTAQAHRIFAEQGWV